MIERWSPNDGDDGAEMWRDPDGDYVIFRDHEHEVSKLKELIEDTSKHLAFLQPAKDAKEWGQPLWRLVKPRMDMLELELRRMMWLSHGHLGLYGDDGEMQCGECLKYGCWDYKRTPLENVRKAYNLAILERAAKE